MHSKCLLIPTRWLLNPTDFHPRPSPNVDKIVGGGSSTMRGSHTCGKMCYVGGWTF